MQTMKKLIEWFIHVFGSVIPISKQPEEPITGAGVSEFPPAEYFAHLYHRSTIPIQRPLSTERVETILNRLREQMHPRTWRPKNRRPRHARY